METTRIGPYILHQKIGAHTWHNVYLATHVDDHAQVALKFVKVPSRVDRELAIKKIQLEIKILKRIQHPNLVRILEAGVDGCWTYFAMELIRGESLASILSRRGKLAWDQAAEYAAQVAKALEYIHGMDLVHLKLNPEKVIRTEGGQIKITDLRVNRAKKRRWDVSRRRSLDVAAYMAPEQLSGAGGTEKSDLYALGVILFESITGRLPFEPDTLPRLKFVKENSTPPAVSDHTLNCPVWIDRLVTQLMASDPKQRPHTATAVSMTLNEVRRLDATGTSAAEQIAGGFNALNAGIDKSEAKRVLGRKQKADHETPFYMTATALTLGLVVVTALMVAMIWFAFRPKSEEYLFQQASAMMEAEKWTVAKEDFLQPLLEHYPDGMYAQQAEEMLEEAEMMNAMRRMKKRIRFGIAAKSEGERQFRVAWEVEQFGDWKRAIELYAEMIQTPPARGEDQPYWDLAQHHLDQLREAQDHTELVKLIEEKLRQADYHMAQEESPKAEQIWRQIVQLYDGDPHLQALVNQARQKLGLPPGETGSDSGTPATNVPAPSADPENAADPQQAALF